MKKLVLIAFLCMAQMLMAQKTWVGGTTGSWNVASNWSPVGVPVATDDVELDGVSATITFSANGDASSLSLINGANVTLLPVDVTSNRRLRLRGGANAFIVDATSTLTLDGSTNGTTNRRMRINFLTAAPTETGSIAGTLNLGPTGAGGQLNTNGANVTVENAATVNHLRNGGGLPAATYNAGSTVNVTARINANIGGLNQVFGNLNWNCPSQTGNQAINAGFGILGTFTVVSTGAGNLRMAGTGQTYSINQFVQTGGLLEVRGTNTTFSIVNSCSLSGGTFNVRPNGGNSTLLLQGDLSITGGTLQRSNGNATVAFAGSSPQLFTFTSGSITGIVDFVVNAGSELSFDNSTTAITGSGDFELEAGATLNVSSPQGVSASGTTGHIQVAGTRTLDAGSNLNYLGVGAQETGTALAGDINNVTVDAATELTVSGSFAANGTLTNDGEMIFVDDVSLNSTSAVSGTGDITIIRNLSTSDIWYELSFPVTTGTVADLSANWPIRTTTTNPGQPNFWNVYQWDAGLADWVAASNSTPLTDKSLKIFAFGAGLNISVSVPNASFNNSATSLVLDYNDGQSSTFLTGSTAETEGWNIHYNPFQAFIDWDLVEPILTSDSRFTNTGVAVKDNTGSYQYYNGGVGTARYIAPNQGFWVQANNTVTAATTLNYTNAMRTATPGSPVSSFKTSTVPVQLTVTVSGAQGDVNTHIAQNANATAGYDAEYDMRWFEGEHTQFYTSDANGSNYGINQTDVLVGQKIPLNFTSNQNGQFTISVDLSKWDKDIKVILKDKQSNTRKRLRNNRSYTFSHTSAANADRFVLIFVPKKSRKSEESLINVSTEKLGKAWFSNNELVIDALVEDAFGDIAVYTAAGQLVYQEKNTALNKTISFNEQAGVYIVHLNFKEGKQAVIKTVKN